MTVYTWHTPTVLIVSSLAGLYDLSAQYDLGLFHDGFSQPICRALRRCAGKSVTHSRVTLPLLTVTALVNGKGQILTIHNRYPYNSHQLECWPMPNVMAAQPNIGGAVCESSVIPFLAVWMTPGAGVPCSNAANTGERKTQSQFCIWQNYVRGKSPQTCIYSAPAQETAKHPVKLCWPPLSNVGAVMKPARKTLEICCGAPTCQ